MTSTASSLPYSVRPPTRIVPSGDVAITAGSSLQVSGTNARDSRIQFAVTNTHASKAVQLCTPSGIPFATVYPQRTYTLETSADFSIFNPAANGESITVEVAELYPDIGNVHGFTPVNPGAQPGGGGGGTGGTGGGSSGGSSGGGGYGGTQPR